MRCRNVVGNSRLRNDIPDVHPANRADAQIHGGWIIKRNVAVGIHRGAGGRNRLVNGVGAKTASTRAKSRDVRAVGHAGAVHVHAHNNRSTLAENGYRQGRAGHCAGEGGGVGANARAHVCLGRT